METNKKNNPAFYYRQGPVEFFNMAPELSDHWDGAEFVEAKAWADFWVFDLTQYEMIMDQLSEVPPTDLELTSPWEQAVMQAVFEIINLELPDGFHIHENGWLVYVSAENTALSYEDALRIFNDSIFRAIKIGHVPHIMAAVVRAVYATQGSAVLTD